MNADNPAVCFQFNDHVSDNNIQPMPPNFLRAIPDFDLFFALDGYTA